MISFNEYISRIQEETDFSEIVLDLEEAFDCYEDDLDEFAEWLENSAEELEEAELAPNEKRITVTVGPNQRKTVVVDKNSGRVTRGALKGKRFNVQKAERKAMKNSAKAEIQKRSNERNAKEHERIKSKHIEAARDVNREQKYAERMASAADKAEAGKYNAAETQHHNAGRSYYNRTGVSKEQERDAEMATRDARSSNIKDRLKAHKFLNKQKAKKENLAKIADEQEKRWANAHYKQFKN